MRFHVWLLVKLYWIHRDTHAEGFVLVFFFLPLRFFELFEKYGGYKTGKLKLKKPKQLQVTSHIYLIKALTVICFDMQMQLIIHYLETEKDICSFFL